MRWAILIVTLVSGNNLVIHYEWGNNINVTFANIKLLSSNYKKRGTRYDLFLNFHGCLIFPKYIISN